MKMMFILSGGLDSTTALYFLRKKHEIEEVLTFDYGQKHLREIACAQKTCKKLGLPHHVINITNLNQFLQGSSLTDKNIPTPHGHYAEENMKKTIVPNRNAIMINIAAGYAVSKGIHALGLGVHSGDHYIYPDCRAEFIEAAQQSLSLGNECNFQILTPFIFLKKDEIVKLGDYDGVPFEETWTCYEGGAKPCSKCGSCFERIEAFHKNDLRDPLYNEKEWHGVVQQSRSTK